MDDGKTRALYIDPSSAEEGIHPLGEKINMDSSDWAGFYAEFEVIGNAEICGDDNAKCRFYFQYLDHERFSMGMGTVQGWLGLDDEKKSDRGQSDSAMGSQKENMVSESKDSPFLIKDAGCFTKDGHPWCKIHIERK